MRRQLGAAPGFCVVGRGRRFRKNGGAARYNFSTFEEYCEERWELTKQHVYHLINAADFGQKVNESLLSLPSRETHIRPLLTRLEQDDNRITVWRDALANRRRD